MEGSFFSLSFNQKGIGLGIVSRSGGKIFGTSVLTGGCRSVIVSIDQIKVSYRVFKHKKG